MLRLRPLPARLVLPSPNGSTIAHALAASVEVCVAASLRNAPAVAAALVERLPAARVVVVAGGERWPDGSLRPAVEDLWGAGAVLAGLAAHGRRLSPEARVAVAAWQAVASGVPEALEGCASGRELVAGGYAEDVRIAAEAGASTVVPVLREGAFTAW